MRSVLTAAMPQMAASTARRSMARWVNSWAEKSFAGRRSVDAATATRQMRLRSCWGFKFMLLSFASLRLRQLSQHLVEVKAGGLLPDGKLLEALQPFPDHGLCGHNYEPAGGEVAPIVGSGLWPALERVRTQVIQVRN